LEEVMKTHRTFITLAMVAAMSLGALGCAARTSLDATAERLRVGAQSQHDVEWLLGEPQAILVLERHPRCAQRWAYSDGTSQAVRSAAPSVLFIDFDQRGVVCDYALGRLVH
jgi:hypothetical protein